MICFLFISFGPNTLIPAWTEQRLVYSIYSEEGKEVVLRCENKRVPTCFGSCFWTCFFGGILNYSVCWGGGGEVRRAMSQTHRFQQSNKKSQHDSIDKVTWKPRETLTDGTKSPFTQCPLVLFDSSRGINTLDIYIDSLIMPVPWEVNSLDRCAG